MNHLVALEGYSLWFIRVRPDERRLSCVAFAKSSPVGHHCDADADGVSTQVTRQSTFFRCGRPEVRDRVSGKESIPHARKPAHAGSTGPPLLAQQYQLRYSVRATPKKRVLSKSSSQGLGLVQAEVQYQKTRLTPVPLTALSNTWDENQRLLSQNIGKLALQLGISLLAHVLTQWVARSHIGGAATSMLLIKVHQRWARLADLQNKRGLMMYSVIGILKSLEQARIDGTVSHRPILTRKPTLRTRTRPASTPSR